MAAAPPEELFLNTLKSDALSTFLGRRVAVSSPLRVICTSQSDVGHEISFTVRAGGAEMGVEVELRCERFTAPPEEYIRCVAQATAGAVLEYVEGSVVNVVVVAPSGAAEERPAIQCERLVWESSASAVPTNDSGERQEEDEEEDAALEDAEEEVRSMTVLWFLATCAPEQLLLAGPSEPAPPAPAAATAAMAEQQQQEPQESQQQKQRWRLFRMMRMGLPELLAEQQQQQQQRDGGDNVDADWGAFWEAATGGEVPETEREALDFWRRRACCEMRAFVGEKNCLALRRLDGHWLRDVRNPLAAVREIHRCFGSLWTMPALRRRQPLGGGGGGSEGGQKDGGGGGGGGGGSGGGEKEADAEAETLYGGRPKKWWIKAGATVGVLAAFGPVGALAGVAGVAAVRHGEDRVAKVFDSVDEDELFITSEHHHYHYGDDGHDEEDDDDEDEDEEDGDGEEDSDEDIDGNAEGKDDNAEGGLRGLGELTTNDGKAGESSAEPISGAAKKLTTASTAAAATVATMTKSVTAFLSARKTGVAAEAHNSQGSSGSSASGGQREAAIRAMAALVKTSLGRERLRGDGFVTLRLLALAHESLPPPASIAASSSSFSAIASPLLPPPPPPPQIERPPLRLDGVGEGMGVVLSDAAVFMRFAHAIYGAKILEGKGLLKRMRPKLLKMLKKKKRKKKEKKEKMKGGDDGEDDDYAVAERAAIAHHAGIRSIDIIELCTRGAGKGSKNKGGGALPGERRSSDDGDQQQEQERQAYPRFMVAKMPAPEQEQEQQQEQQQQQQQQQPPHPVTVVVAIRGTLTLADVLLDLQCRPVPFLGGTAHSGAVAATRALLSRLEPTLKYVRTRHKGCRIVVTGHSLGAACACLLTMLLKDRQRQEEKRAEAAAVAAAGAAVSAARRQGLGEKEGAEAKEGGGAAAPDELRDHEILCFAFAPPPVFAFNPGVPLVDDEADDGTEAATRPPNPACSALAAAEATTCFCHGADVVSRWSYRTAWLLGRQVRCVDRLSDPVRAPPVGDGGGGGGGGGGSQAGAPRPWTSFERGARATGAVSKASTAEAIQAATADFTAWRNNRRPGGGGASAVDPTRPDLPAMVLPGTVYHLLRPGDDDGDYYDDNNKNGNGNGNDDPLRVPRKLAHLKKKKKQQQYVCRRLVDQSILTQEAIRLLGHGSPISDHEAHRYEEAIQGARSSAASAARAAAAASSAPPPPTRTTAPADYRSPMLPPPTCDV